MSDRRLVLSLVPAFFFLSLGCSTGAPGTETNPRPEPTREPVNEPTPEPTKEPSSDDGGGDEKPAENPEVNSTNQLLVTHQPEGGTARLVALVQFDERHRPTPTMLTGDQAAYAPFDTLWQEISAKEKLGWKHHDETGLVGTEHGSGDFNYVFAVEQAISSTTGFKVEMSSGRALKVDRGGFRVAIMNVRDNARGELHIIQEGEDAKLLEKLWDGLKDKEQLGMDTGVKTDHGIEHGTKLVPKGDPQYPWAVWSSLEVDGFLLDAV